MSLEPAEPTIINLSAKMTPSQAKFNRRMREERGNRCEVCGKTNADEQIEAHHILDRREYPQHAKNPENILVVCQPCHSSLTDLTGDSIKKDILGYASLPADIRQRIAAFLEANQPALITVIQALRRGRGYANAVFGWRMEHKSLHPPEAFIRRFEAEEAAQDAFLKEEAKNVKTKPLDPVGSQSKNPTQQGGKPKLTPQAGRNYEALMRQSDESKRRFPGVRMKGFFK